MVSEVNSDDVALRTVSLFDKLQDMSHAYGGSLLICNRNFCNLIHDHTAALRTMGPSEMTAMRISELGWMVAMASGKALTNM